MNIVPLYESMIIEGRIQIREGSLMKHKLVYRKWRYFRRKYSKLTDHSTIQILTDSAIFSPRDENLGVLMSIVCSVYVCDECAARYVYNLFYDVFSWSMME